MAISNLTGRKKPIYRKPIYIVAAILLILAILFIIFVYIPLVQSIPSYNREVQFSSLDQPVTIRRDEWAIPHIYASNEKDALRGLGYVMAEDRLFQMDFLWRIAAGRLGELFGYRESIQEADIFFRVLGIAKKIREKVALLPQELKDNYEAFIDGITFYVKTYPEKLPFEYKALGAKPKDRYDIEDLYCILGFLAQNMNFGYDHDVLFDKVQKKVPSELLHYFIGTQADKAQTISATNRSKNDTGLSLFVNPLQDLKNPLYSTAPLFQGSNSLVISKEKSANNEVLLENDPHIGYTTPVIFYQAHIDCPELKVYGSFLPGIPYPILAHNEDLAWGLTMTMLDESDYFIGERDKDASDHYIYDGKKVPFTYRKEEIKFGKNGKEGTLNLEVEETNIGPVIGSFDTDLYKPISMKWSFIDVASNELYSFYLLSKASNWTEFREALSYYGTPAINVTYADVEGNIGYQTAGLIPIRSGKVTPFYMNDAEIKLKPWVGYVPYAKNPFQFNPPEGYVINANVPVKENYPYYLSNYYKPDYRKERMIEIITEKGRVSQEDLQQMTMDNKALHLASLKNFLIVNLSSYKDRLKNEDLTTLNQLLAKRPEVMEKDSWETFAIHEIYNFLLQESLLDYMGIELFVQYATKNIMNAYFVDMLIDGKLYNDKNFSDKKRDRWEIISTAIEKALQNLKYYMGANPADWQWSKVHRLTIFHPLGMGTPLDPFVNIHAEGIDSGSEAINVQESSMFSIMQTENGFALDNDPHNRYKVKMGPVTRRIVNLTDWDKSVSIILTGQSGHFMSQHYKDQHQLWLKGQFHPDYWTKKAVEDHTKYETKLNP